MSAKQNTVGNMKQSLIRWGAALLVVTAMAGCGGGGGATAPVTTPPTGTAVNTAITTAAAVAVNDTATTPNAAFTVLQAAGVPAVTINSPPVVNFAVFSDGAVKTGLVLSNVRFAIAKLVPGTNGNPDEWKSYISVNKKAAVGVGPGGTPAMATAKQATTDGSMSLEEVAAAGLVGQLTYNADGYYSYAFKTDIKDITKTSGVTYEPTLTHRVAIQLSYKNAAGAKVSVNPYFDFTIADGKAVPAAASQTRKMADVTSCNNCHEKLALHGGGRVDTQYCVMCHNPGTVDPESGNNLNMSTMVHKIHAGKLLKSQLAAGGEDYAIWGYGNAKHDYAEVGFPQDLRNCSVCHSASNPNTPQGDNWKIKVSQGACLTCHASNAGSAWNTSHAAIAISVLKSPSAKAKDMGDQLCAGCHLGDVTISPERVHWNQNEENAAKYKMNIEGVSYAPAAAGDSTKKGTVTVKYFLSDPTNGNAAYALQVPGKCDTATDITVRANTTACGAEKFGNLRFYVAYQNMVGQSSAVTEYSSYNNGGSGANVYAYKGTADASNHYTVDIAIPADTATAVAAGTARVISIGQIKEPKIDLRSANRTAVVPTVLINVVAQNTFKEFAVSGVLNPRRVLVSNEKCNVCHGALGTTSGSNTLAAAFHSGARNTVESCVLCHDANRASSGNMMTNGLVLYESYQMKSMIHGIHGNSKRLYPFTHGNKVAGVYNKDGTSATGGAPLAATGVENYAAEVAWPGVGVNCNACHVNNSYKQDLGTLGAVVMKPASAASAAVLESDPNKWLVISPMAATCTSCHDSSKAIGHVTVFSDPPAAFGDKTQGQINGLPREGCYDCHASGKFKGIDLVHGQK